MTEPVPLLHLFSVLVFNDQCQSLRSMDDGRRDLTCTNDDHVVAHKAIGTKNEHLAITDPEEERTDHSVRLD